MGRRLLFCLVFLGFAAFAACSGEGGQDLVAGRSELLLAGTPYATPLHVFQGSRTAKTVLVLGGVHGDEPGGWLAAERLAAEPRTHGHTLLVLPRANALAVEAGVRSSSELGDLNRLYGADPDLLPMAAVAAEIVDVIRRYRVDVVVDLHESWQSHRDRPGEGVDTAFLGQTISPHRGEPSRSLARAVVRRVNRGLADAQRFAYHEFPEDYEEREIVPLPDHVPVQAVPNQSGLVLAEMFPGLASLLVEVSQQQDIEQRVEQHLAVVDAVLREVARWPFDAIVGQMSGSRGR